MYGGGPCPEYVGDIIAESGDETSGESGGGEVRWIRRKTQFQDRISDDNIFYEKKTTNLDI